METTILLPTPENISHAALLLEKGEIVAFPTETVYGLAASIFDDRAIQKIFEVKGRPSDNPLIAHISSLSQLDMIAEHIPKPFEILAHRFFPGPLTLVVKKKSTVSTLASAGLSTIGIRMPNHQVAKALIEAMGKPLVAPSANLSGKPSPTTAQHVFDDLQGKIPLILDGGPCDIGIESTVVDLTVSPLTILRPGYITQEQLENIIHQPVVFAGNTSDVAKAPGMKYRHYAPIANVYAVSTLEELHDVDISKAMILTNVSEQTLYANFRRADEEHIPSIIIVLDRTIKNNKGLMNRIEKAIQK